MIEDGCEARPPLTRRVPLRFTILTVMMKPNRGVVVVAADGGTGEEGMCADVRGKCGPDAICIRSESGMMMG